MTMIARLLAFLLLVLIAEQAMAVRLLEPAPSPLPPRAVGGHQLCAGPLCAQHGWIQALRFTCVYVNPGRPQGDGAKSGERRNT